MHTRQLRLWKWCADFAGKRGPDARTHLIQMPTDPIGVGEHTRKTLLDAVAMRLVHSQIVRRVAISVMRNLVDSASEAWAVVRALVMTPPMLLSKVDTLNSALGQILLHVSWREGFAQSAPNQLKDLLFTRNRCVRLVASHLTVFLESNNNVREFAQALIRTAETTLTDTGRDIVLALLMMIYISALVDRNTGVLSK